MNHEYIHINKACKKYNKSRQTFYNYMNKGRIRNKKVHNKVFLHDEDIHKVLSDTIQIEVIDSKNNQKDSEIAKKNLDGGGRDETQDIELYHEEEEKDISVLHKTKKWMDDMHTSLSTHIDISMKDLQNSTSNKISDIQDQMILENKTLKERIAYLQKELETQKKSSGLHEFVYGFILLASIISILLYIFS